MRFISKTVPILILLSLLSCESNHETIRQIQKLEYSRTIDRDRFIQWLNDDEAVIRAQAVKSLGRIQDTSTISWVANRLSDPVDSIRGLAAFALGQFFSPEAEKPLQDAYQLEKSDEIRKVMLKALGKSGTDRSFILLRNALEGENPEYQGEAALACAILAFRGYPAYDLMNLLNDILHKTDDTRTAWRSAYAFYRLGSASSFNVLADLFTHPDPLTRYFVLKTHGLLVNYINTDGSGRVGSSPLLAGIANRIKSGKYLRDISGLMQDSSWYVRTEALQLAAALKSPALYAQVTTLAEDDNPHVHNAAIYAVAAYETAAAGQFLNRILSASSDWRKRGAALVGLSRFRPKQVLSFIQNNMSTVGWPENFYFIQALAGIGNREAAELLKKMTDTESRAQLTLVLERLSYRPRGLSQEMMEHYLQLHDPAITSIIAEEAAVQNDTALVPVLMESYRHFKAPRDIEPMLAILAAVDSLSNRPPAAFLQVIIDSSEYRPLREAADRALNNSGSRKSVPEEFPAKTVTRSDFSQVDVPENPRVTFSTTRGDFQMELYPDKAPVTVANFLDLVQKDFYNGIYFHRVVPVYVVQAGDPRGDGWGGPGYSIPCEYNDIFYDRGTVGMAHAGKDTGGSQFFITHIPQPHLNGRYTAFGRVIEGMEVVDRIQVYDRILSAEITREK